jgi:drug/metabolite transporter (DMT)-like permease
MVHLVNGTAVDEKALLRPGIGMALMIVASLLLPLVDGIAKILTENHSAFLIAWARYSAAALVVAPLVPALRHGSRGLAADFTSNALRTVLAAAAMTCFFLAIARIPIGTALGGYFIGPVVAAVLAARLLGETIDVGRLGAVFAGLVGAFLILKPGAAFEFGSLMALASGALFAGYLVATRMTASTTPPIDALRFQCLFGAALLTPLAALNWSWPSGQEMLLIGAMGVLSALCHFMVIAAFRHAETAVLSPLIYLELVTALLFGQIVLSERPDLPEFIGIACIVAGGLIVVITERGRSSIEE